MLLVAHGEINIIQVNDAHKTGTPFKKLAENLQYIKCIIAERQRGCNLRLSEVELSVKTITMKVICSKSILHS